MLLSTSELKNTITLFCGGDVNIGRRMNYLLRKKKPFVRIEEMRQADCRMVNLECVIGTHGEQSSVKHYFYLRARPEQTNILTKANIDIVTTANNHAGDYGTESLLEELGYLDAAGILHAGSGRNFEEAFAPVYKKVGDITLAIFSVDSRKRTSAATNDSPGTAYLSINKPELWKEVFKDRIREAHKKAHVVIVCPHWGMNKVYTPSEETKNIAHLLIDLGADVVLGCHAHFFQGVENYKDRPIIYDLGDFLFDSIRRPAGCFNLEISADGVEKINFVPLIKDFGQTLKAGVNLAKRIAESFVKLCREFKTDVTISDKGVAEIRFNPPPREVELTDDFVDIERERRLIEPLSEPRPEWTVDRVPDEAIIPPQKFGAIKLIGYYVPPECRTLTEPRMLYVETYWTLDEPFDKDCLLTIKGVPARECDAPIYGQGKITHDFLDYMYPVNRWKAGVIYREKIGLLPPRNENKLVNVDLRIEISVTADEEILGEWKAPDLIKMQIEGLLYHKTEFDDIIYQSEAGKCWTAEQLAKVTGGEWLVPPPAGWYAQSFRLAANNTEVKPRPTLLLATNDKAYSKLLAQMNELDGAIVSHDVEGLPEDFPLLKVDDVERAIFELGVASRKRFQGKVIAVTGSNGKTTTCNMLEHVLIDNHRITATSENRNLYSQVPWVFAHVNQDDAFAILEVSLPALAEARGSITYDITPDIAVVTAIAPAHLSHKNIGTLEGLAKYKSRIFCGMTPGSYAILNRDMPCYEIFEQKAKAFNLNVITFGTHEEATVRMPELKDGAEFFVADKSYKLSCPVPAEQLYDALAVVAVSVAVGISVDKTLEHLKTFSPVKGRGNVLKVNFAGKNLTVIDSTYNANIGSMTYALQHLKTFEPNKKARMAIVGDIAALGNKSVELHKGLAKSMLAAEPDRLLLCGEFMRYPYNMIKDKLNVTWFKTLDELLKNLGEHLRDGDTVLVKSSHATGLSKVVELLTKSEKPLTLNVPKPLFNVQDCLPEGITPELNGRMPDDKLKKIHCGGRLYLDAARAWLAMVRAAAQDAVFLSVNKSFNAYRDIERQIRVFEERYTPLDRAEVSESIRVEYDGKIWQLKPDNNYAAVPSTSSHGYGLAVDIQNVNNDSVKAWLKENAEAFGFVQEYDFEPWHFTYIKAREGLPARVLEVENLPPEPTYTAKEIEQVSGGKWLNPPPKAWTCNGMFYKRPAKAGCLAVIRQGGLGVSEQYVGKIARQLAGFICTEPESLAELNRPILVVEDIQEAVKKLKDFFKQA